VFIFFKNQIFADVPYPDVKIYVSQDGDDQASGKYPQAPSDNSNNGPVKTLKRAQQVLRELKQSNPNQRYAITLRRGYYPQAEIFNLTAEDSGVSENNPTTIESYPGETVAIVGADRQNLDWQACGPECQASGVYKAYLPDQAKFNALYINGQRARRARTPNDTGSYSQRHYYFGETIVDQGDTAKCNSYFYYQPGQINPNWRNLDQVEVVWRHMYLEYHDRVIAVDSSANKVSFEPAQTDPYFLKKYCFNHFDSTDPAKRSRFFVENVFEGLDSSGEYYFDSSSKWLYYYPRNGESADRLDVRIPQATGLIQIGNTGASAPLTQNIKIKNIEFFFTDFDKKPSEVFLSKSAIEIHNSQNISIENNKVNNVSGAGVFVDSSSKNIGIINNEISYTGTDGVSMGARRDNATGTDQGSIADGVIISNNSIHDTGVNSALFTAPVILRDAGYAEVSHNLIYNAPYDGIGKYQTPDVDRVPRLPVKIQYNEIKNVMQKLNDGGGVHLCSYFGSTAQVNNNYIHDISLTQWRPPNKSDIAAIYYDCSGAPTGADSYKNLIVNVPLGINVVNAGANKVYNNILVDVPGNAANGPVNISLCCYTTSICTQSTTSYGFSKSPNSFYKNILYYKTDTGDPANPTRPIYFNADANICFDRNLFDKVIVERDRNLYFDYSGVDTVHPSVYANNGGPQLKQWSWLENIWLTNGITNLENNSIFTDPQFENPGSKDYRLKPTSPAITQLGFESFDFREAGVKEPFGPSQECPIFIAPPSGWCPNGELVAQSPTASGCQLPPVCVVKNEVTFRRGFTPFGASTVPSLETFSQNNLTLYKFDGASNKWLLYPSGNLDSTKAFEGYYVYNFGEAKTLTFGFGNPIVSSYGLAKGWNMLWTMLDKNFSNLNLTIDGTTDTAQNFINGGQIEHNIYIISNEQAATSCEYFQILNPQDISANCSGSSQILGRSSKIPGGKAFWVYVK